jgi:hypothetical protein
MQVLPMWKQISKRMYLDLVFPRFMDYARGVVMARPLILHADPSLIFWRHYTDLLAMLTSGGVAAHSDHSQSASANIVVPSVEFRCGRKQIAWNYQWITYYVCWLKILCVLSHPPCSFVINSYPPLMLLMSVGVGHFSYTTSYLNSKLDRSQFVTVDLTEPVKTSLSTGMKIITRYIRCIVSTDRWCQGIVEPE